MTNREILEELLAYDAEIRELSIRIKNEEQAAKELTARLNQAIEYRRKQKERILVRITKLDNSLHRQVLVGKYCNGKSVLEISSLIHYSVSRTYEIIRDAEDSLKL